MNSHFEPEFAGKRIWMYWPGEKAYQFKENVEKGFMACGLPEDREVGDLDVIMNIRGGLDAALKEAYGTFGDRLVTSYWLAVSSTISSVSAS